MKSIWQLPHFLCVQSVSFHLEFIRTRPENNSSHVLFYFKRYNWDEKAEHTEPLIWIIMTWSLYCINTRLLPITSILQDKRQFKFTFKGLSHPNKYVNIQMLILYTNVTSSQSILCQRVIKYTTTKLTKFFVMSS